MIGQVCLAHRSHHTRVPIQLHHVQPAARGGIGTGTVQLCANAHGLVHDLLDVIESLASISPYATVVEVVRSVPRATWSRYPGSVRVIAYKGWQAYGLSFLNHRYDTHYRYWSTDGSAKSADVPAYSDIGHAARWSRQWRHQMERISRE